MIANSCNSANYLHSLSVSIVSMIIIDLFLVAPRTSGQVRPRPRYRYHGILWVYSSVSSDFSVVRSTSGMAEVTISSLCAERRKLFVSRTGWPTDLVVVVSWIVARGIIGECTRTGCWWWIDLHHHPPGRSSCRCLASQPASWWPTFESSLPSMHNEEERIIIMIIYNWEWSESYCLLCMPYNVL